MSDDPAQTAANDDANASVATRTPSAPTKSGGRAVRFLTKPELVITDQGVQVRFDLVNRGPARVGFRFDIRIDGHTIELVKPELALSTSGGPVGVGLKLPLEPDPSAKFTVTVKGLNGQSLAVGSNGVSLGLKSGGLRLAVGTKGLSIGLATIVGVVGVGAVAAAKWDDLFGSPSDPVETVQDDTSPPDTTPSDTTPPDTTTSAPIGPEPIAVGIPASVSLPLQMPEDELDFPLLDVPSVVVKFDPVRAAITEEATSLLGDENVAAEVYSLELGLGDDAQTLGEIVLPVLIPAEHGTANNVVVLPPARGQFAVAENLLLNASCVPEDDPETTVGEWRTVGGAGVVAVELELELDPNIEPVLRIAVTLQTTVKYFVDEERPGLDLDRCHEIVDSTSVWSGGTDADRVPTEPMDDETTTTTTSTTTTSVTTTTVAAGDGDDSAPELTYVAEPIRGALELGDEGERVRALQRGLASAGHLRADQVDGQFGPATLDALEELQRVRGLDVDGIAGPAVHDALGLAYDGVGANDTSDTGGSEVVYIDEPPTGPLLLGHRGPRVRDVQLRLVQLALLADTDVDGDFGPQTERAVTRFQETRGLETDGIAGPITLARLKSETS